MVKVRCKRVDAKGVLSIDGIYLVDNLVDVDSYVHMLSGRYIGMYPSVWFEEIKWP